MQKRSLFPYILSIFLIGVGVLILSTTSAPWGIRSGIVLILLGGLILGLASGDLDHPQRPAP